MRPSSRLGLFAALTLAACSPAAWAGSLELQVAPLISRTSSSGPCPQTLTLIETLQPFREGSYGIDGRAPLAALASGWRLSSRDGFSVSWSADLVAAYRGCRASAGIVRVDRQPYRDHSYLRLRFLGRQVQLILDMTGLRDPNTYTPQILSAGVNQGVPVWSWGGSD